MFQRPPDVPNELVQDAALTTGKALPPVSVSALTLAGVGLEDWVYILTLIYLVLTIGLQIPKAAGLIKGLFNRG